MHSGNSAHPATTDRDPAKPGPRVIAIANQKGGVGKTTTAINLGASLAIAERPTLIIDLDPQANATSGLGIRREVGMLTIYECMVNGKPLGDAVHPAVHVPCLSAVPAGRDLVGAQVELVEHPRRETILRDSLRLCRTTMSSF